MKIAVAVEEQKISQHFGHSQGFYIYEIMENEPLKKEYLPSPGHRPGFLPVFLSDNGVNVIIAGGMGETAQQLFAQNNIEVIIGVEGYSDDAVQKYSSGKLCSKGSFCKEHHHD